MAQTTLKALNPATCESHGQVFLLPTRRRVKPMLLNQHMTALYQGPWADYTATERGKLIYKLGDLISEHSSELGDLETMR